MILTLERCLHRELLFNAGDRGGRIFLGKPEIFLPHSKSSFEFDNPFPDSEKFSSPSLLYTVYLNTKRSNLDKPNQALNMTAP